MLLYSRRDELLVKQRVGWEGLSRTFHNRGGVGQLQREQPRQRERERNDQQGGKLQGEHADGNQQIHHPHPRQRGAHLGPDAGDVPIHGPDGREQRRLQVWALVWLACMHTGTSGQTDKIFLDLVGSINAGCRSGHFVWLASAPCQASSCVPKHMQGLYFGLAVHRANVTFGRDKLKRQV